MGKLEQLKKDFVIDQAMKLFEKDGIAGVTVADIAAACEMGEATIYRYFGKKQNIVLACGIRMADRILNVMNREEENLSGFAQLRRFYGIFPEVFRGQPELYRFIYRFDAYLVQEKLEDLNEYEDTLDSFKEIFDRSYARGLEDGTVCALEKPEIFYYATTHALLNLCKKLSMEPITVKDTQISKTEEIETIITLILNGLRKEA